MDWHQESLSFHRLDLSEIHLGLSDRASTEALAKYNRAVQNLQNDNDDIAAIELRKLCATVPSFGQAHLLLGCRLMVAGSPVAAGRSFRRASECDLPDDLAARAALYSTEAASSSAVLSSGDSPPQPPAEAGSVEFDARSMSGLIRPSKENHRTGRVSRGGDRRSALPNIGIRGLLILLLAVGLLTGAVLAFPAIQAALSRGTDMPTTTPTNACDTPTPPQDSAVRLAWLLDRIGALRSSGASASEELERLLKEYEEAFPGSMTPTPTPEPTQVPVLTPTPTRPDPANILLANSERIELAVERIAAKDYSGAADLLLLSRADLAGIPSGTTVEGVEGDAAKTLAGAETLLAGIAGSACEAFRRLGMDLFTEQKDYAGALVPFVKAYSIDPRYYGGGVAYYAGRCLQTLGRKEEARPYFLFVVEEFAGRDIAVKAQSRLDEIGAATAVP